MVVIKKKTECTRVVSINSRGGRVFTRLFFEQDEPCGNKGLHSWVK